jgi:hypothetical protein
MRPSGSCQMLGGTTATFVPCRLDSAAPLRTPTSGLRMLARLADCRIAVDIETIGIVEVAALAARARWLAAGAFSCSRSSLSGRPTPGFASTEARLANPPECRASFCELNMPDRECTDWAYRTRTAESVDGLSDWIYVTTRPEQGAPGWRRPSRVSCMMRVSSSAKISADDLQTGSRR